MLIIKSWIGNICAALIFLTAVELILPDNSLKKYSKLVLGLILMIVVINPLLAILNKNINPESLIERYMSSEYTGHTQKEYKLKNVEVTEKKFNENLKLTLGEILKEEFNDYKFNIEVTSVYNEKKEVMEIKQINIGYSDKSISSIEKIKINGKSTPALKSVDTKDIKGEKIKASIETKTKIPIDKINVYKL